MEKRTGYSRAPCFPSPENLGKAHEKFIFRPCSFSFYNITSLFVSFCQKQHFANRKPKAVRVGDILITYAVGARKIISVFKVMSSPKHTNIPNDRWPWFVEANNLTTNLGKTWAKKSLMVMNVAREYAEIYKLPVTQHGGYNLNGPMHGNDKIQLPDKFGRYLFVLAMEANKE